MNTEPMFTPKTADLMARRHFQHLKTALQFAANAAEWIEQDDTGAMLALFDNQYPACAAAMDYFTTPAHLTPDTYDYVSDLYLALGRYLDIRSLDVERQRWGNILVKTADLPLPPDILERTAHVVNADGSPRVLDDAALDAISPDELHDMAEMVNLRGYGLWVTGRREAALLAWL